MSYRTVEVELENGRVRPSGAEILPTKARALLTILEPGLAANENLNTSLADLTADLAGLGRGEHSDLSSNRAHFDDFGR